MDNIQKQKLDKNVTRMVNSSVLKKMYDLLDQFSEQERKEEIAASAVLTGMFIVGVLWFVF